MSAAAAAPDAAEAAPKKGKKKLIIIIAAVAVLLLGGGGAAFYVMKKNAAAAEEAAAEGEDGEHGSHAEKKPKEKKEKKKDDKHALPVFVPLDPFTVNLADRDSDRFAQIGITLQVEDAHAGDEIKAYLPAIRNNILLLLSRKSAQDLAGAEGKELLAEEILHVAVQPMGIELPPPGEEEAPAKGKKKKRYDSIEDSPIKHVQFSSFIIQ
ncbi:flagellar basal body-associated FliL family protein [Ideonella sp. 4Y16]|uniref:Flagellar protein FliL n=1 Tax=Ideonella alba TaxID=2824118 RepID=A0A940YB21_9BURK|nr:flagellar basal body-associated FliL family protein [Ideonella alba]MBQ0929741.1 flagellar basal body-associated FliL family protein [Ideonella alba]MBQ0941981.1 flagellar basal body-associated FliL family protein [Ideonella alba]